MVIKRLTTPHRSTLALAAVLAGAGTAGLPFDSVGLLTGRAQAQTAVNPAPIETLRVPRGGQVAIPLSNVTRVLSGDEEIVRGKFEADQAFIEGVATGVTLVAVQQGSGDGAVVRQYEVEVLDAVIPVMIEPVITPELPPLTSTPVPVAATATTTTTTTTTTSSTPPFGVEVPVAAIAADRANLTLSLGVEPAEDNPSQALFTITYNNTGGAPASGVVIRYALDDMVSYVTNSATGGGRYDAAKREIAWNVGTLPANATGQAASFRIAALDPSVDRFFSVATIEDASEIAVASNTLEYSFGPTPLLTVFALPDRIIEGRSSPSLVDVRGIDYQKAIERLQKVGVVRGTAPGIYKPNDKAQRSEYTVMILRSLNLRDLRDLSAIKFVLSRRSTVRLEVRNSDGRVVAPLIQSASFEAGEHTAIWDGRTATGFAPPGRYSYVCSARDIKGVTTELRGYIHVIPQTPLQPSGLPSFTDIRPTAWYSGYIALAEKQGLVQGYPNREFRPQNPINRVEATAVVVRAMGLEDLAKRAGNREAGFLDDHIIPNWAKGYVYVASSVAKTSSGQLIVGYPSNEYRPLLPMRRDEAAMVVQRLVDKETNRKLYVSGQMVPGAVVTINQENVQAADDGSFSFVLEQNNADPMSVAVVDRRR